VIGRVEWHSVGRQRGGVCIKRRRVARIPDKSFLDREVFDRVRGGGGGFLESNTSLGGQYEKGPLRKLEKENRWGVS